MEVQIQAFFSTGSRQKLFNVMVSPVDMQNCKAILLFIPALLDEMNHSRHLVSAQARLLAADGIATLILDPEGTGDSYGDYASADWDIWLDDYANTWQQLSAEYDVPVIFWAMRAGTLLIGDLLRRCKTQTTPVLLWSPVFDGEMVLREMIRLKLAGMMMGNEQPESMKSIRGDLNNGKMLNMAGYEIPGQFAVQLAASKPAEIIPDKSVVVWVDVVRNCAAPESPAKAKIRNRLEDNDSTVFYSKVEGPAFWQSVELVSNPDLLTMTRNELNKALA